MTSFAFCKYISETPLISTVLTCGRLVTVKLNLIKTVTADASKFVLGTDCIPRRSHGTIKIGASTEQQFVADNFPIFGKLAASHK